MIINCHVHLNNYHEESAVTLDQSLEKLQAAMAEAQVSYALILTSYLVNANRPSTADVRRLVYTIWRRVYRVRRPLSSREFRSMMRALAGRSRVGQRELPAG